MEAASTVALKIFELMILSWCGSANVDRPVWISWFGSARVDRLVWIGVQATGVKHSGAIPISSGLARTTDGKGLQ